MKPAVWFPSVRAGTGTDVFTQRLCEGLRAKGLQAEISWLPRHAEYLPWTVAVPEVPRWANVVHVNTWLHRRFIPKHLPVLATMHLCVHDSALTPYKRRAQAFYHRHWIKPLEAGVLQRASQVVAVSNYTASRTREAFGSEGVAVIHNGVPTHSECDQPSVRQPHTPFRLLYVGNWSMRKGVDMLGPIMGALGGEFELWYTADARGADCGAPLPTNCRCIGRLNQKQLRKAYLDADVLLFPSRLEGLPLAVIEAMACGLPVVANNSSSLAEVVTHGKTGYLCDENCLSSFVSYIRELSVNQSLWNRMRQAACQEVSARFSESRLISEYMRFYDRLLSSSNKDLIGPEPI